MLGAIALAVLASCATAKSITFGHERAAREIVRLTFSSEPDRVDALAELIGQLGLGSLGHHPFTTGLDELTELQKERVRGAYKLWARELLTPPQMEDLLARIWVKHFSESEIEELITFYRTPVGAKFSRLPFYFVRKVLEATPVRDAFERWDGASPLPPELREVAAEFVQDFSRSEIEELKRFFDSPGGRKSAELVQGLIAETTREVERLIRAPGRLRQLEDLLGATGVPGPTVISDPIRRVEFDGFSILPPKGKGWFMLKPPPQVDPNMTVRAYFIKRLTEGVTSPAELHRLTAVVRTLNVGDVKIENRIDFLKGIAGGFSGKSFLDKCSGWDCVRYRSTSEDRKNPKFPGHVFVISKQGFVVLHPDSPTLVINVEYRQYYARDVQPLSADALEKEVEPFQESLEFTAARPAVNAPTPAGWASQMEGGAKTYEGQRWSDVEAAFKAALDEAEMSFGTQDRRVAQTLYYLAIAHRRQGRYAEVEPFAQRALPIYERTGTEQVATTNLGLGG